MRETVHGNANEKAEAQCFGFFAAQPETSPV
jgi:hypothetical protein